MDSSQGSTLSTNVAGLVDGSPGCGKACYVDYLPVYAKELIAGGAAGAVAKTAVAPLERTKILLQTRTEGFRSLGVYGSLKKLVKHEGVLGFYKGNGASVLRIVPYAALHYMTYEQYRCWILNNYSAFGTGPVIDLLAGSAAGGTAVLCTYPLDLARAKLAYQVVDTRGSFRNGMRKLEAQPAYNGIRDVIQSVYKEGGVRSLYRGVGPTLIGILPYAGLKFYIYEKLKSQVPEEHQKSIMMRLSCGALAGLFGQTFTYPLDVVRRQMQVENLMPSTQGAVRYRNTLEGLTTIVRTQGWRQLFAGLSINYIKTRRALKVSQVFAFHMGVAAVVSSQCVTKARKGAQCFARHMVGVSGVLLMAALRREHMFLQVAWWWEKVFIPRWDVLEDCAWRDPILCSTWRQ